MAALVSALPCRNVAAANPLLFSKSERRLWIRQTRPAGQLPPVINAILSGRDSSPGGSMRQQTKAVYHRKSSNPEN
ncbi:hypothetical protein HFN57_31375 [Rhizobium leguminosarum]|uniref:hypothetical protein n=1 Tax=Rhizobium leguminosarum TaxID=384 RepID=UPI001441ABA7|nr:hypothetical protein [Rhizobium leguminosarum]MBY5840953.1 hypothetical protein [Rhizobium leguminosarum]